MEVPLTQIVDALEANDIEKLPVLQAMLAFMRKMVSESCNYMVFWIVIFAGQCVRYFIVLNFACFAYFRPRGVLPNFQSVPLFLF